MLTKRTLLIGFLFCTNLSLFSQSAAPYQYIGNYTQPAPSVASLGKFVDYPVGYYTGTPQIGIPLYELQDGAAKSSISLSYHSSGIKVAELSSWIGLGWALNAGGMITRSVRGGPDEGVYSVQTPAGGYYRDSGIKKMPLLPYPVNGIIPSNNNDEEDRKNFRKAIQAGNGDSEPDLFTFNFDGYGGKFVFDENRTARLLTNQDLKIAVVNSGTLLSSWIITTPNGIRYYFGDGGIKEVNSLFSTGSGFDNNSLVPSSWLLTKVIYPNTKDTLIFNYVQERYSYFDLAQETAIFDGASSPMQQACQIEPRPANAYKTTVAGYRLKNIISRNYRIEFGVNTLAARQDLINSGVDYPYSLDSVKVYNSQNQCLKQFVLTHGYFNSTSANNWGPGIGGFTFNDLTDTKRLKLISVKEYSGDGLISKPAYDVKYEETLQLPRRLSYDIDHWGFSNNYPGNINERFTPAVYHPVCFLPAGPASNRNREPKWPDMQQFSLKSIKDPLGVLTTFQFEPHRSSVVTPDLVGGLRIQKITNTDSVTGISNARIYTYGDGGTLYKTPKYLLFPANEFYFPVNGAFAGSYYGGYNVLNVLTVAMKQSQSVAPLQDFQGNHIGYSSVKEQFGINGEGGYKIYNFVADQLAGNTSRLHMSNYTASATIATARGLFTGTYGNGQFNDILPQNLAYYDGYDVDSYFPIAPAQVDFRRGQLIRESVYDSAGKILHDTYNSYSQSFNEDAQIRGFKIFRSTNMAPVNNPGFSTDASFNDAMTFYKLHTGISHVASTINTEYKDGKKMVSKTYFKYESPFHTLKTADSTINSTGDVIVNKTYYSFDYLNTATADNVIGKMKARNMLLPVATRTWKNGQLLSGSVTLYKDYSSLSTDTFINPAKIYALETQSPLTTLQAGENVPFTSQFSTLLPNTFFKEKASFLIDGSTGKIIEQKLVNDKNQVLIWDEKFSVPLAQIENASYSDVAYSGFESSSLGNWVYNISSVAADATALSGSRVYNIAGGISKTGLTTNRKYILSYWQKTGALPTITGGTQTNGITGRVINGWTYKQLTVTGTSNISLGGTGSIDEIRVYPVDAQMTTYTYDALMRLTAQCSPASTFTFFDYDSMNRLLDVKDQFGNIIKTYNYNYGRASRPGQ